jgi:hypothetical protein
MRSRGKRLSAIDGPRNQEGAANPSPGHLEVVAQDQVPGLGLWPGPRAGFVAAARTAISDPPATRAAPAAGCGSNEFGGVWLLAQGKITAKAMLNDDSTLLAWDTHGYAAKYHAGGASPWQLRDPSGVVIGAAAPKAQVLVESAGPCDGSSRRWPGGCSTAVGPEAMAVPAGGRHGLQ